MKKIETISKGSTEAERDNRGALLRALKESSIPDGELLENLGLFQRRQELARLLFMHDLYRKILPVHGVVVEFGARWGQNLAWFSNFRALYEPYNYNRKIIGFDTFAGFPSTHQKDGRGRAANYSVAKGYEDELAKILQSHQDNAPLPHMPKFELIKGDAVKTFPKYLKEHPETIVALAYFDFDLYLPTKECLKAVESRLTKGSIVAFDELNCDVFPGETAALQEVFGLGRYAIRRDPLNPLCSYFIVE